jgi:DNA-binding NarL/FixJ family response regulator
MLFLSFHTVGNHRKNILRKLSAHSKAEIVDFAHKNNLI